MVPDCWVAEAVVLVAAVGRVAAESEGAMAADKAEDWAEARKRCSPPPPSAAAPATTASQVAWARLS